MIKCTKCSGFIPEFSIEWSETLDTQKCRCAIPGLPDSPLVKLIKEWLSENWKGNDVE